MWGGEKKLIPDITLKITMRKINGFWSYYFCAILLSLVLDCIINKKYLRHFIAGIISFIPNLLMVRGAGIAFDNEFFTMTGDWYLSVMILSCFLLIPFLLFNYEWCVKLIFPILGLFGLGMLTQKFGSFIVLRQVEGLFIGGMWRGLCEMALGATAFELSRYIGKFADSVLYKIILTIVKYASLGVAFLYVSGNFETITSAIALIGLFFFVSLSFSSGTYKIREFWYCDILGKISLPIFLSHCTIRRLGITKYGSNISKIEVYKLIVISLVFSMLVMCLGECIKRIIKMIRDNYNRAVV